MEAEREFRQFSEQLRLHTSSFSNLSIGDSIWSAFPAGRTADDRRNVELAAPLPDPKPVDWKLGFGAGQKLAFGSHKLDRLNNSSSSLGSGKNAAYFSGGYVSNSNSNNVGVKNYFDQAVGNPVASGVIGDRKKNNVSSGKAAVNKKNGKTGGDGGNPNGAAVDKRFKTLPPEEALPRNEAIGGYIFVCNNDTMQENLRRQLFGLPQRYRDSVRTITPGLPLFLYNYSTHQLHGVFESASFGGTNIDPTAWEDKKKPGESRFPAQVRVLTRKNCEPLEEDSFRPVLHHYDGPKFRLELSVPEAVDVLDKFTEQNS